jgi:hypothetical protein
MIVEVEKVDFNNLKKGKKYQIKHDIISTGTFWEYKQLFKEPHASFFERDNDVMVKHSYPPHYEYYRILSLEELHAKKVKFNIFEKTHYDDLKKDEMYKFDTYDASFRFKFGPFAVFREVFFNENNSLYNVTNHDRDEIYYRYVSEEEYRKKRRDKFNENALKTILKNIIDEYIS